MVDGDFIIIVQKIAQNAAFTNCENVLVKINI